MQMKCHKIIDSKKLITVLPKNDENQSEKECNYGMKELLSLWGN